MTFLEYINGKQIIKEDNTIQIKTIDSQIEMVKKQLENLKNQEETLNKKIADLMKRKADLGGSVVTEPK